MDQYPNRLTDQYPMIHDLMEYSGISCGKANNNHQIHRPSSYGSSQFHKPQNGDMVGVAKSGILYS